jgi:hypothetical protein
LKRVLDHDPLSGVTEIFHYDELTKDVHVETRQDVTPILDQNKEFQNDDSYWKEGVKNDMAHFATIPILVQLEWLNKYGPENDPMRKGNERLLFRLLNSPDYRYLKTTNKIHLGR